MPLAGREPQIHALLPRATVNAAIDTASNNAGWVTMVWIPVDWPGGMVSRVIRICGYQHLRLSVR